MDADLIITSDRQSLLMFVLECMITKNDDVRLSNPWVMTCYKRFIQRYHQNYT